MSQQETSLFDVIDRMTQEAHSSRLNIARPSPPAFGGKTYDEKRDGEALRGQLERVKAVMLSNDWLSLSEIARLANVSESTVGSRVRDLRKSHFGGYSIPTKVVRRTWYYRIER